MTVAIHVLSYLTSAERRRRGHVTSHEIASSVNTNPVVIRRILGLLREAGLARSHRGTHAGWTLARPPSALTLLDVYQAVEEGPIFGLHASTPNQACPIGRGLPPALHEVYGAIEDKVRRELARTTIEQVLEETIG